MAAPLPVYSKFGLRDSIGYAPQDVFLFSDTVHDNVAFGKPDASREAVEEACRQASIFESIQQFPQGFDTLIGERGTTLFRRAKAASLHCPGLDQKPAHPNPR